MKDEGYFFNIYYYSFLFNFYFWKGDYKKVDELMIEMKLVGLVLNKVCVC